MNVNVNVISWGEPASWCSHLGRRRHHHRLSRRLSRRRYRRRRRRYRRRRRRRHYLRRRRSHHQCHSAIRCRSFRRTAPPIWLDGARKIAHTLPRTDLW